MLEKPPDLPPEPFTPQSRKRARDNLTRLIHGPDPLAEFHKRGGGKGQPRKFSPEFEGLLHETITEWRQELKQQGKRKNLKTMCRELADEEQGFFQWKSKYGDRETYVAHLVYMVQHYGQRRRGDHKYWNIAHMTWLSAVRRGQRARLQVSNPTPKRTRKRRYK